MSLISNPKFLNKSNFCALFPVYGVLKLLEFYVFLCLQSRFKTERVAFMLFVVSLLFWIWDCTPTKQSLMQWNHFAEVVADVANFIKLQGKGFRTKVQKWYDGDDIWQLSNCDIIQFLCSITDYKAARRGFKLRVWAAVPKKAFRFPKYGPTWKAVRSQTHAFFYLFFKYIMGFQWHWVISDHTLYKP